MKITHLIGFFRGKGKSYKIANSLQIAGFRGSDIVTEENTDNAFLLSVSTGDEYEYKMAENIFEYYGVQHIYHFDLNILNGEELRRIVSNMNKLDFHPVKSLNPHHHYREGISSEVSFGRRT